MNESPQALEVKQKLAELEQSLLERHPGMPTLLRDIHRQLKKDPEVVTLLTEDECATLVNGLKRQTSASIATSALKTKTKAQSKMTVDDL